MTGQSTIIKWLGPLVFIAAFLLYANTIGNEYNLDDELVTINHPLTSNGLSAVSEIFSSSYYKDGMGYSYGYRPISHLSFALEHELFGINPHVSHAINVLIYALSCLLVFLFVRRITPKYSPYFALVVTAIFLIHPIHTEVVASIKNRDELLALLFGLLALLVLPHQKDKFGTLRVLATIAFFVLSLLSKKSFFGLIVIVPYLSYSIYRIRLSSSIMLGVLLSIVAFFFVSLNNRWHQLGAAILPLAATLSLELIYYKLSRIKQAFELIKDGKQRSGITFAFVSFGLIAILLALYSTVLVLVIAAVILAAIFTVYEEGWKRMAGIAVLICSVGLLFDQNVVMVLGAGVLLFYQYQVEQNRDYRSYLWLVLFYISVLFTAGAIEGVVVLSFVALMTTITFDKFPKLTIVVFSILAITMAREYLFHLNFIVPLTLVVLLSSYHFFKKEHKLMLVLPLLLSLFYFSGDRWANVREVAGITQESVILDITDNEFNETAFSEDVSVIARVNKGRQTEVVENPLANVQEMKVLIPNGLNTSLFYIAKLCFPYPLSFYYGYNQIPVVGWNSLVVWVSIFLHLGLIVLFLLSFRKHPLVSLGILGYGASIVLFSNILLPVAGIVGERLSYVASIWFILLICGGAMVIYKKYLRNYQKPLLLALTLILVLAAVFVVHRNTLWKNRITLFEHDIKHLGNSAQGNALLAYAYITQLSTEQNDQAIGTIAGKGIQSFDKAINVYDEFLNWWFDKGRLHELIQDPEAAIYAYEKAIEIDPIFSFDVYLRLGRMYGDIGDISKSITAYQQAQQLGYNDPAIYNYISQQYAELGNYTAAESTLIQGLETYPNEASYYMNLGQVYLMQDKREIALITFKKALAIIPDNPNLNAVISNLENEL